MIFSLVLGAGEQGTRGSQGSSVHGMQPAGKGSNMPRRSKVGKMIHMSAGDGHVTTAQDLARLRKTMRRPVKTDEIPELKGLVHYPQGGNSNCRQRGILIVANQPELNGEPGVRKFPCQRETSVPNADAWAELAPSRRLWCLFTSFVPVVGAWPSRSPA